MGSTVHALDTTQPRRYLRSVVAIARAIGVGEYLVVSLRSGLWRTDRLGARTIQALIDGRSDDEALALAEQMEPGSAVRAQRLIDQLEAAGSLTSAERQPAGRGRRRLTGRVVGLGVTATCATLRWLPVVALRRVFEALPSSPVAKSLWRSRQHVIVRNLRRGGFQDRPAEWLRDTGRACAAASPSNGLFQFLGVVLPRDRLDRLATSLFDKESLDAASERVRTAGPVVGVFLHGPLITAVPNALRSRGHALVRTITGGSHGTNVSQRSRQLGQFFGDSTGQAVEVVDALASAELVRHLKAGRSVFIALERLPGTRIAPAIDMVGRQFPRNDGPAWLAVRSGRPLVLWSTHRSRDGIVLEASDLLEPNVSLHPEARVADLSQQLYAAAEVAIRARPDAWPCWGYLDYLTLPEAPKPGETGT